jgi:transposase InsO family protein
LNFSRSGARYQERPRADENQLVEHLHEFAKRRRRRGYRLVHQELQRAGMKVNHKRVHRLWRREGLSVPPRRSRKRIRGAAKPRLMEAQHPHQVWCLDFLEESTLRGSKLRILSVSDEFTRQSLAIEARHSFRCERVCVVLEGLMKKHGIPQALRMDNGPEFVALALRGLCHRKSINPSYIEPGRPWQNGYLPRGRPRASTPGYETSSWTGRCSPQREKRRCDWMPGDETGTLSGSIRACGISRLKNMPRAGKKTC